MGSQNTFFMKYFNFLLTADTIKQIDIKKWTSENVSCLNFYLEMLLSHQGT